MHALKWTYKVVRSILLTVIVTVAGIYLLTYILLSIPAVQDKVKGEAERQLTAFLGGRVEIGDFDFYPFNEAILKDVSIHDPKGDKCIGIGKLGAGIRLWRLISTGQIEITYAELIDGDFQITQATPDAPLNIQFLIDAFSPKDKNKPPASFDVKIHNVVIRRCKASYSRLWMPHGSNTLQFDPNYISVTDLNADITLPQFKNDDFTVDVRRIALKSGSFVLKNLSLKTHITPTSISLADLVVQLPGTDIRPSDISLNFPSFKELPNTLKDTSHSLVILDSRITPSDLAYFVPQLSNLTTPYFLTAEITGDGRHVAIDQFRLAQNPRSPMINIQGDLYGLTSPGHLRADIDNISLRLSDSDISTLLSLLPSLPVNLHTMIGKAGNLMLDADVDYVQAAGQLRAKGFFDASNIGNLDFDANCVLPHTSSKEISISGTAKSDGIDVSPLLNSNLLGKVIFDAEADVRIIGSDISGNASAYIPSIIFNGQPISEIHLDATKESEHLALNLDVDDPNFMVYVDADAALRGAASEWNLNLSVSDFVPSRFVNIPQLHNAVVSLDAEGYAVGDNIDNLIGQLNLSGLHIKGAPIGDICLNEFDVLSTVEEGTHHFEIDSDFISGYVESDILPSHLPALFQNMIAKVLPDLVQSPKLETIGAVDGDGEFRFTVKKNPMFTSLFHLPMEWLTDFNITGAFAANPGFLSLQTDIPYIRQGKNKLVRNTSLLVEIDETDATAKANVGTVMPVKNGDLHLEVNAESVAGQMDLITWFNRSEESSFKGNLHLGANFINSHSTGITSHPGISLHIYPTSIYLNNAEWRIGEADLTYADKQLNVDDFNIRHADQYVIINGSAGSNPDDIINISLADFDLQYLFDTLNINYVNFGGNATGEIYATDVFSGTPRAAVRRLHVNGLKYNGSLLGDAELSASWDHPEKCVRIGADISEDNRQVALMDGGIWVTRDSLSLAFDTHKLNIGFLHPFMAAFASEIKGRASGKAKIYGTFKDVDMEGRLYADTVTMRLGYTNVEYSGKDSVIIDPGHIHIPEFRLYDRNGNYGLFKGELYHRYFHEPSFNFQLTDAHDLLCYDTTSEMNPDWWGTIYGSGMAVINGLPDKVDILANMVTEKKSSFTFVLSERQDASDYKFLTFSDKKKEAELALKPKEEPDFLEEFKKKAQQEEGPGTAVEIDIRADITPAAQITLVMDPTSGDKIKARGTGNLNLTYATASDEMGMFGRYTLAEGVYNFSLQDLILKDFIIKEGSTISFNGDPMDALLDITAAYRVNTNLTDLDKSFANDKELNRTSVPVDALLKVNGDLTSPDITFDIALPTLTEETARKVRSIISTEDMMSRQIIYLLALNRFYTPEYMGSSSNGGEWASVASSTISSQLSNMLGQLTDKVNVMPSLRSDKGDFSDVEVDVALSSRLLNNRLLLNGNFGYRDRTTSNTTFVGDFDIEYLLKPNGNLRLKAYNHFNDQNYYLKSSLTTQGIGIIYRRDFNHLFRPKKKYD